MEGRRRFDDDRPGRYRRWWFANGWTSLGANGATVFGTILVLKLLDEDFRGEHLEYFWLGAIASFALWAVGLFLAARRRRGEDGS